MVKLQIIAASVREGRLGERVVKWAETEARDIPELEVEVVDLATYELPVFDLPLIPAAPHDQYNLPGARAWSEKIDAADAYLIVTPEYNHSVPGGLKNAIDYLGSEIVGKSAGIVTYSVSPGGGIRSGEHLLQILSHMGLNVIGKQVSLPMVMKTIDESGKLLTPGADKALQDILRQIVATAPIPTLAA